MFLVSSAFYQSIAVLSLLIGDTKNYSIEFKLQIKDPQKSGIPQYISVKKIDDSESKTTIYFRLFFFDLKFETSLVFEQFMMCYLIQFKDK